MPWNERKQGALKYVGDKISIIIIHKSKLRNVREIGAMVSLAAINPPMFSRARSPPMLFGHSWLLVVTGSAGQHKKSSHSDGMEPRRKLLLLCCYLLDILDYNACKKQDVICSTRYTPEVSSLALNSLQPKSYIAKVSTRAAQTWEDVVWICNWHYQVPIMSSLTICSREKNIVIC